MTAVNLWVVVPKCVRCMHSEARWIEAEPGPPRVFGQHWAAGYAALGVSRRDIRAVRMALDDGSWQPTCYWCGNGIDVIGEGFSLRRVGISRYFELDHEGRKPRDWMKEAVLRGFGSRCASCKKRLSVETATFDHMLAFSTGGLTEVSNLQVLCQRCNGAKANREVDRVDAILTFLLRPTPSDGFEGVIW